MSGTYDQVRVGEYPNLALGVVAGCVAAVLAGTLFGLVNGLLVTRLRINSFIVTLGTMGIGTGLAYVVSKRRQRGKRSSGTSDRLRNPEAVRHRPLSDDRRPDHLGSALVHAAGDTLRAAIHWRSAHRARRRNARGIRSSRHILVLFILMGSLAGVAAMLDLTRFATTNIGGHQTTALAAIAAVVIGGTSLFGGRATIAGSMVASLIPVMLGTGLVILGVPSFYQLIVVGTILIAAVFIDQRRRERLS